jgi:hypothetical protein
VCPCPDDCYCKAHTCKSKKNVRPRQEKTEETVTVQITLRKETVDRIAELQKLLPGVTNRADVIAAATNISLQTIKEKGAVEDWGSEYMKQ